MCVYVNPCSQGSCRPASRCSVISDLDDLNNTVLDSSPCRSLGAIIAVQVNKVVLHYN